MSLFITDLQIDSEASQLGLLAEAALGQGDTARAQTLHQQAAERLAATIDDFQKPSERDLVRFLAATQYYKGGHYQEALKLCKKIKIDRLPRRVRDLYPPFLKNVQERSAVDYRSKMTAILKGHFAAGRCDKVLEMLQEHPYLVSPARMAYLRARSCAKLGDRKAATLFLSDAWRFEPNNANYLSFYLFNLSQEGRFAEAWQIVERQLSAGPRLQTFIDALMVRSSQVHATKSEEERLRLRADQVKYFELAWNQYHELPPGQRDIPHFSMAFALMLALLAYRELGNAEGQLEVLNRWVDFAPNSPDARVARGTMTYPSQVAIRDLRRAIELGTQEPWPYILLAHNAFSAKEWSRCDQLCTEALRRNPTPEVRADLLHWQAIARSVLGSHSFEEIKSLFAEASTLAPDDEIIRHNAEVFKRKLSDSLSPVRKDDSDQWYTNRVRDLYSARQQKRISEQMDQVLELAR